VGGGATSAVWNTCPKGGPRWLEFHGKQLKGKKSTIGASFVWESATTPSGQEGDTLEVQAINKPATKDRNRKKKNLSQVSRDDC